MFNALFRSPEEYRWASAFVKHVRLPKRVTTSWLIVTFGEAGDTARFRMYIDEI